MPSPTPHRQFPVSTRDGALLRVREYLPPTDPAPGAPVVVLAHGWTLSHRSWLPVIERLHRSCAVRVVTYDQRAHGGSSPGPGRVPIRELGNDLHAVLAVAAPTGSLVLGGHSMGGMTILAYAGLHPCELRSRVRGVALVSTAAGGLRGRPREGLVMKALARAPRVPAGRFITEKGQRTLLFGENPRPEDITATRDQVAQTTLPTMGRFYLAFGEHDESEALDALAEVPTTILVGDMDKLTPVTLARRMHERVPHSQLHVLPGLGHMLPYEAADEVADQLVSLVNRAAPADDHSAEEIGLA